LLGEFVFARLLVGDAEHFGWRSIVNVLALKVVSILGDKGAGQLSDGKPL
jgi:hypothetical protein